MPGKNYIKVASVLLVIGAVISIIIYPIAGLLLEYATVKTGESLGWLFVAVCVFYSVLAVLQLIASVKGIKCCNDKDASSGLKKWGWILLVISLISGIASFVQTVLNDGSIITSAVGILIGLILPALFIHGAALNENA